MWKVGPGGKLFLVLVGIGVLAYSSDRYLGRARLFRLLGLRREPPVVLTPIDFPAGSSSPVGDLALVPTRPLRVAAAPRASAASLLLAAGGVGLRREGVSSKSYGLDLDITLANEEGPLTQPLLKGGDLGGLDAAVISVDRLAQLNATLRDARLKAVLLVARSRGNEAIAADATVNQIAGLRGKRIAVAPGSPARFFLMWSLAQALISPSHVQLIPTSSPTEAARMLREGQAEAAAGLTPEVGAAAKGRGGRVLTTSADAPHLAAHVLVMRADLLARFPDAGRRLVMALLDSADSMAHDPTEAAQLISLHVPQVGEPFEALRNEATASLSDNLAFFGVRGDCPVRFDELYTSAAQLWLKLGEPADNSPPHTARDLAPLLAAQGAAGPSAADAGITIRR